MLVLAMVSSLDASSESFSAWSSLTKSAASAAAASAFVVPAIVVAPAAGGDPEDGAGEGA